VLLGVVVATGIFLVQENKRIIDDANSTPEQVSVARSASTATIVALVISTLFLLTIGTYAFYRYARADRISKDQIQAAYLQSPPSESEQEKPAKNENQPSGTKNKLPKTKTPTQILMEMAKRGNLGNAQLDPESALGKEFSSSIQTNITKGMSVDKAVEDATRTVVKSSGIKTDNKAVSKKDYDNLYEKFGVEKKTVNGSEVWDPTPEQSGEINNLLELRNQINQYNFYKKEINGEGNWLDFLEFQKAKVDSPWNTGEKITGSELIYLRMTGIKKQLTEEQVREVNGFVKRESEESDNISLPSLGEEEKQEQNAFAKASKDKNLVDLEKRFESLANEAEDIDDKLSTADSAEKRQAEKEKSDNEKNVKQLKEDVDTYLFSLETKGLSDEDYRARVLRAAIVIELVNNLEAYNKGGDTRNKVYGKDSGALKRQKVYKNVSLEPGVYGEDTQAWVSARKKKKEKEAYENETIDEKVQRLFAAVENKIADSLHSEWKRLRKRKEEVNEKLDKADKQFKKRQANKEAAALNDDIRKLNGKIDDSSAHIEELIPAQV
jgi:hypothetical protein